MAEKKKKFFTFSSQLRRDPVTEDWIVIATARNFRPNELSPKKSFRIDPGIKNCPFEDLEKSGHKNPVLEVFKNKKDWFLKIIENKFPAFSLQEKSLLEEQNGPYKILSGFGSHELLILRDHNKPIADYSINDLAIILRALQKRTADFFNDLRINYVSIFHNWGPTAGASIYHPHFQIIAIPVVPPTIKRVVEGSCRYFSKTGKCIHCEMIDFEKKEEKRIIFENDEAVAFSPFVSREPFEIRIYPKKHQPFFEKSDENSILKVGEALRFSLKSLKKKLNDPDLNFFIHTGSAREKNSPDCFHWHIEIIPRVSISAGFELSTGIEITAMDPDVGAAYLRKKK